MEKIRIKTAEDLANLPEGEWFEVQGGTRIEHQIGIFVVERGKLTIKIPQEVLSLFRPHPGGRLRARLRGTDLVVEK